MERSAPIGRFHHRVKAASKYTSLGSHWSELLLHLEGISGYLL